MAIEYSDYQNANYVTHGRTFHSDEVFCIPIFEYLYKDIKLCRLSSEDEDAAKPLSGQIWFDIGGGELDHHQKGGNGFHKLTTKNRKPIPYASFGLVWRKYGLDVCRKYFYQKQSESCYDDLVKYAFDFMELNLVRGIDASDNGIFPMKPDIAYKDSGNSMDIRSITISYMISTFNPVHEYDVDECKGFNQAIDLAKHVIFAFLETAAQAFNKNIPVEDAKFEVDNDFKTTLYSICLDILGIKEDQLFENNASQHLHNDAFKLYKIWESTKEAYLISKFGSDWQLADKGVTSLVNGICAEMEGLCSSPRRRYDEVYFASLKDVFGNKSYYLGDYENDLRTVISVLFEKVFLNSQLRINSEKFMKNAIIAQKGHILELPEKTYWKEMVSSLPEAERFWFVIMPTQTGLWKVNPVRSRKTLNGYRKGFPASWLGLRRKQLEERKIYGVNFIHVSGIMALCDDKISAIKLCKKAFGNSENSNM